MHVWQYFGSLWLSSGTIFIGISPIACLRLHKAKPSGKSNRTKIKWPGNPQKRGWFAVKIDKGVMTVKYLMTIRIDKGALTVNLLPIK